MGKLEEFKGFVKDNPKLLQYVKNGEKTWQNFYEIYDLYGNSSDAWKDYLGVKETAAVAAAGTVGLAEVVNWFKNINLESVQSGVNNLQRVLSVVQDLSSKDTKPKTEEYKPRPVYKHFED